MPTLAQGWIDMNERIKELSKQAGDYVNEVYTGPVRSKTPGKIWEDGHVDWHTQFNEKFAELIVAECVKLQYKNVVVGGVSDSNRGRRELTEDIQKHFGVEE